MLGLGWSRLFSRASGVSFARHHTRLRKSVRDGPRLYHPSHLAVATSGQLEILVLLVFLADLCPQRGWDQTVDAGVHRAQQGVIAGPELGRQLDLLAVGGDLEPLGAAADAQLLVRRPLAAEHAFFAHQGVEAAALGAGELVFVPGYSGGGRLPSRQL